MSQKSTEREGQGGGGSVLRVFRQRFKEELRSPKWCLVRGPQEERKELFFCIYHWGVAIAGAFDESETREIAAKVKPRFSFIVQLELLMRNSLISGDM